VKTTGSKAAAAARIGAALGRRKRAELLELLQPCFARTEPWLQAGKYAAAVMSDLRRRNGRTIAERSGDRTPDRTQRLLNRAVWDTFAAMGVVRRFAVSGLDEAARKTGRRRGLAVGAVDETGQVKSGTRTAGMKRQYMGCVGKVANGINTVHLTYAREGTGHALIGAREWIPARHIDDLVTSAAMGLPADLAFRHHRVRRPPARPRLLRGLGRRQPRHRPPAQRGDHLRPPYPPRHPRDLPHRDRPPRQRRRHRQRVLQAFADQAIPQRRAGDADRNRRQVPPGPGLPGPAAQPR
jgi:hypothetical protein